MSKKVLIKIDAVGSKKWVEGALDSQARRNQLMNELNETVNSIYKNANQEYPDGEYVSAQGDCLNLIVDNVEYAIYKTIEFQKEWFKKTEEYPDCRAIIDFGDVRAFDKTPKKEFLSEAFENISVIEKNVGKGEIFITKNVFDEIDSGEFKIKEFTPVKITDSREVSVYKIDYDDPRAIEEDYLVQTIFVADKLSDTIRDKTIGFVIIQTIISSETGSKNIKDLIDVVSKKGVKITEEYLERIIKNNTFLSYTNGIATIKQDKKTELANIKDTFEKEKERAIAFMAERISSAFGGFTAEEFRTYVNFEELLEDYLFSVFGDIKNIILYYNSERIQDFYDRFSNSNYFDAILKEKSKRIPNLDEENRILFKQEFLTALALLTKQENKYISCLFHNILTNFYLNRNEKYLKKQLERLRKKEFYFDTNTFYSYKVPASQYNKKAQYIFDKLKSFNFNLKIFSITVEEYNSTLQASKKAYDTDSCSARTGNKIPWIILEFVNNERKYGCDFAYCVKKYMIDSENKELFAKKEKIKIENVDNPFEYKELSDICQFIKNVKRNRINENSFDDKMIHDAQCLKLLQSPKQGFEADRFFVTCDFALAKMRRLTPYGNSLVTINELYEMLLPYLMVSDNIFSNPEHLPNMLLEAAIDLELGDSIKIEQIIGEYLKGENHRTNYRILNSNMMAEKFKQIEKKNAVIETSAISEEESAIQYAKNFDLFRNEYYSEVRRDTINKIHAYQLQEKEAQLSEANRQNEQKNERIKLLSEKLEKFESKEKRRKKYEKTKERRQSRSLMKNNKKRKKRKRR